MGDVVFVGLAILLLAASAAYVEACRRLLHAPDRDAGRGEP